MPHHDKYKNFEALSKGEDPTAYSICCMDRSSRVAIIAPHGGKIEPRTSEIAEAIASEDFSYYSFKGEKDAGNRDLHITSTNFNEPKCLNLVQNCEIVIAIHGEGDSVNERIYMGGLNTELKNAIGNSLSEAGFTVVPPPHRYPASNNDNICNQGKQQRGVQIELSRRLRTNMKGKRLADFVNSVRSAINACAP